MRAWLTTVVARLCLNALQSRRARREWSLEAAPSPTSNPLVDQDAFDPEHEALLADAVGPALLVVLDTLTPAERVAFVLHDVFSVSFDEVASVVGRTPEATRQLASRARRRVQGASARPAPDLDRQREVVEAFLAAARRGDFDALVAVLDPAIAVRADDGAVRMGFQSELFGAVDVARAAARARARGATLAFLNGQVGLALGPEGRFVGVLQFTLWEDRIIRMEAIANADRLREIEITALAS
jgi:RNA polymerase sigma-70 factor (ECF subfamily)